MGSPADRQVAAKRATARASLALYEELCARGVSVHHVNCESVVSALLRRGALDLPKLAEPDPPMTGQTTIEDHLL